MNPRTLIVTACLWAVHAFADDGVIYRYMDPQGVIEVSTTLPPQRADNGYQVLDGRTAECLRSVPPAAAAVGPTLDERCPTADELAERREKLRMFGREHS